MLGVSESDSCECLTDTRTKTCSRCSSADDEDEDDIRTNCVKECAWTKRSWTKSMVLLFYMLNVASAHYTPQWAVHIVGGKEVADRIAAKHGFNNLGEIFDDYYHFEHKAVRKRSLEPEREYHSNLINEAEVKWAKQQVVKKRSKRDLIPLRTRGTKFDKVRFNDVRWPQMWYLNRGQGLDMNVQQAWQDGISGKGVVVTILDDGLEKDHPDLVRNYDPQASYDVNNHDEDPMPRYDLIDSNRHGTRCAGEVAAVANNTLCSVGVAFGASVGGVRMLDGDVTDAVEARSLSLNPQHIDIYSASWGPDDDGKTVDGPGELATRAFIEGVTKGRQGKGSIFVWASGNGGRDHDNCNCDGYTNSIWTLSISSATENGLVPWYSEACSSTLATTYSSGSSGEKQIVTTDLHHQCTSGHTGTSASAPLAAGICALALEANKDLTWRDMQHIVVRTARPANLKSPDWKVNGVGRNVSHSFGYGLMDASAMVRLARTWKTVPEQHRCEVSAPHVDKLIPARSKVILNLTVTECNGVNFLEHVQAKISLSSSRRGDLQIYLTSPARTRVTLLAKRPQDSSRNPFNAWPFMSVHTWGEMPFGIWQLEIHNEGRFLGHFEGWQMLLYGTELAPNGDSSSDNNISNNGGKPALPGDVNIEDDVPNHLDPETPNRGWKDPRHDVQRTTTEGSSSSSGCISFSKSTSQCIECMRGLYLYEGRCEAVCPARTYPGINAKERAACQPCHYTCLTCVGESDDQCTSCFDEAVAIPSPSKHVEDNKKLELVNVTEDPGIFPLPKPKVTDDTFTVDDDNVHLSYGKRSSHLLVNRGDNVVVRKKAVTKKILENYNKPRPLYYCYPARMMEEINSSNWYYRMTILFTINFILLSSFLLYYVYSKCCYNKKSRGYFNIQDLKYKYSKMKNGDSNVIKGSAADNIIYVSTSEEEE